MTYSQTRGGEKRDAGAPLPGPLGVTLMGLGANLVLASSKVLAGVALGSQAILADGLHGATDMLTDLSVLTGLGVSDKPADESHPYGHGRVSTLVALLVGLMLAGLAVYVGGKALVTLPEILRRPPAQTRSPLPLILAALTIPIKEVLYRLTAAVARRSRDMSLRANAWHHRSDAFTSAAAAAGLGGIWLGGSDWAFLDPLTAMVLGTFLLVGAGRIVWDSAAELIDSAPAEAAVARIRGAIASTPGVREFHALRAREVGGQITMDVHVMVDPDLSVREGHDIAGRVKRVVMDAEDDVTEVVVHIEPADGSA